MTDRISGFVVTLERDLREDDAEATLNAIRQIKGVLTVEPQGADFMAQMSESRVLHRLRRKVYDALDDLK